MTTDEALLARAVALAERCPPSETAFSVGALVVGPDGAVLADGWSRRRGGSEHAEESALADLGDGWQAPAGTTVYSSLEPCSRRASRPLTCTQLILAAGVTRVVFAWREPPTFVEGAGAELLHAAGVEVVELPAFADAARKPNRHLLDR
ncbi:dCMP deaminase [Pseudonocardia sp. TRM90224]|uniref:dCMP deaminase n=1 Tax=Pseudonocardia sp. TRM90224 TaxID=2812678 RepID=UPI001E390160|nr:dCMP deaminase [Pseudonocardia sp. TRM90224]